MEKSGGHCWQWWWLHSFTHQRWKTHFGIWTWRRFLFISYLTNLTFFLRFNYSYNSPTSDGWFCSQNLDTPEPYTNNNESRWDPPCHGVCSWISDNSQHCRQHSPWWRRTSRCCNIDWGEVILHLHWMYLQPQHQRWICRFSFRLRQFLQYLQLWRVSFSVEKVTLEL